MNTNPKLSIRFHWIKLKTQNSAQRVSQHETVDLVTPNRNSSQNNEASVVNDDLNLPLFFGLECGNGFVIE